MSVSGKILTAYYRLRPFIPRSAQIRMRRHLIRVKRNRCRHIWPIAESSAQPPEGWNGWPEGKEFALILTHDVDTAQGQERCIRLMETEMELGFRSSFNFVARRYPVDCGLLQTLARNGFEVGVHGLTHDGKLFSSRSVFLERAPHINRYLSAWGAVGFRAPAMHCNLDWIHQLQIEYDASTFDTDPFEPQPQGVGTIFPFWVQERMNGTGYVELPYTLPQDFTLFVLMREVSTAIWEEKLGWIARHGGMVLLNTHPDYMNFENRANEIEEYPASFYRRFLERIIAGYANRFWHVLPREMAGYWKKYHREANRAWTHPSAR